EDESRRIESSVGRRAQPQGGGASREPVQPQDPPARGHAGVGLRRDQEQARSGAHPDAADAENQFEQGRPQDREARGSEACGDEVMSENTQQQPAERGQPKSRIGTVLSNKM